MKLALSVKAVVLSTLWHAGQIRFFLQELELYECLFDHRWQFKAWSILGHAARMLEHSVLLLYDVDAMCHHNRW